MVSSKSRNDEIDDSIAAIVYSSYGAVHNEDEEEDLLVKDEAEDEAEKQFQYLRQMSAPFISLTEPAYSSNQGHTRGLFLSVRQVYKSSVRDTISKAFQFGGTPSSVRDVKGSATMPNEVLNLVKNIVGAGALALPNGVASFANAPSVLYPAAFWLVFMAAIFGYYFLLLGRTCKFTATSSYAEAWERTMGEAGSGFVAFAVALKAGMGNLECSIILCESLKNLAAAVGWNVSRTTALLSITLAVLLPLCLLKNLAVLAPFSMLGLLAMLFTSVAMTIRYLDGSYDPNGNGKFLDDIDDNMQPSFGTTGAMAAFHLNVLVFLCMISEAYIAHYNAPRFWVELKNRSVKRFATVVSWSYFISASYYVFVTSIGFSTFGANSSGFVLDNYSTNDILASISRACVGFSLIFTYPVIFLGFRDAMLDVLVVPHAMRTSHNLNLLTLILLTIITVLAMVFKDLGVVVAVGGGTLGTVVVFIVPSLMFCKAVSMHGDKASAELIHETKLTLALMWFGIFMGVVGVWIALTK
jgi:amino acid permease